MKVFDASACLAILFEETGMETAIGHIAGGMISAVNHSEVLAKLTDRGVTLDEAIERTNALSLEIIAFDARESRLAAQFRGPTQKANVSFADRACLALAQMLGAPVVTADRKWADLEVGVDVVLLR